jgi:hypothetical protein
MTIAKVTDHISTVNDHDDHRKRPTPPYRRIVEATAEIATEHGHDDIRTEHLLLAEPIQHTAAVARIREATDRN